MNRVVSFGEIMGRLATPGFKRFQQTMPGPVELTFAGAEASVAASIAYLGGDAAFVTALPKNALADACIANLRSLGVDTREILRTTAGRLGLYFLETGANQRPGNVIYDREGAAVSLAPPEAYDWERILAHASWLVLSGITPALSRNAAAVTQVALHTAGKCGVPVAFDLNYRNKLWRWDPPLEPRQLATRTLRELMPGISLLIGGREDTRELLGLSPAQKRESSFESDLELGREVVAQFPKVARVALTLREGVSASHQNWGGLLYEAATDQIFYAPLEGGRYHPYAITDIVDRLGGGDAFTAGLLFALGTPELADPQTAVSFAVAASCLSHSIEGDFNYSTRDEIQALMGGATSGRVNR